MCLSSTKFPCYRTTPLKQNLFNSTLNHRKCSNSSYNFHESLLCVKGVPRLLNNNVSSYKKYLVLNITLFSFCNFGPQLLHRLLDVRKIFRTKAAQMLVFSNWKYIRILVTRSGTVKMYNEYNFILYNEYNYNSFCRL